MSHRTAKGSLSAAPSPARATLHHTLLGLALPSALAFALTALPQTAHAQRTRPEPVVGAETSLHIGIGSFVNTTASAFFETSRGTSTLLGIGPAGILVLGARLLPWLSVGGTLTYQFSPSQNLDQRLTYGQSDTLAFGFYTRIYPAPWFRWSRIDPWISLGIDPASQVFLLTRGNEEGLRVQLSAVSIPIGIGVDVRINRYFAVGIQGSWAHWFPLVACVGLEVQTAQTPCGARGLRENDRLFAGIGLRALIPD